MYSQSINKGLFSTISSIFQHQLQMASSTRSYLWLIANKDVVIHGLRDIVDVKLEVSSFWYTYKAHTSPCRAAI